jgi:geranylgeranyl pyrophosphate synthase
MPRSSVARPEASSPTHDDGATAGVAEVARAPRFRGPGGAPDLLPARRLAALHDAYRSRLPVGPGIERSLAGVLGDALGHPGSLYRAQVAWGILSAHGAEPEAAVDQAIAIEYFHTASLLFDDLPAMDDAAQRRGRPCPHRTWGEASTMLGALALITRAYELLWRSLGDAPAERRERATSLVSACLGLDGILNGQALDLHFAAAERSGADVLRVAEGKTVSLIRLTLVLPALTAGVGDDVLDRLDGLASDWGLAYQVLDDFKDCLLSHEESGKTPARDGLLGRPNLPLVAGWEPALRRLEGLLASAAQRLAPLAADGDRWAPLVRLQSVLDGELADVRRRLPRRACA